MKKILPFLSALIMSAATFTAQAAPGVTTTDDPYESFNRNIFSFNQGVDQYFFRPIAQGYRYVTPDPIRDRIGNAADNIMEPLSFVNSMLQGDFERGMKTFWRFAINTTIGLGGLNDVATTAGIPRQQEDFGQTLAVWGVDSGPYLVLPLVGSSSVRDFGGFVGDYFLNPFSWALWNEGEVQVAMNAGRLLVLRERFIDPIDDINQSSLDPYASYRSIYQQRRTAEIKNRPSNMIKIQ